MKHKSSFIVFPEDANHMYPVIFGGKFMAEMDLCAAQCVRKILTFSPTSENGVTYKASFEFDKACLVGDIVALEASVTEVRHRSITVDVTARRIKKGKEPEFVASGHFVFISIRPDGSRVDGKLPYVEHQLTEDDIAREIEDW